MNSLMGYSLKDVMPPSALLKKAELLSANKKLFNNPQDDNKEIIDALMRKKNLTEKQAKLFAIEHDLI